MSPVEDENSREVFGLIKKLNIAADTKKKAKSLCKIPLILVSPCGILLLSILGSYSSKLPGFYISYAAFFENMLTGGNSNSSSRVSFQAPIYLEPRIILASIMTIIHHWFLYMKH